MAYLKGGKVQSTDLNTFSNSFNTIWGIGSSSQGYGQTSIIGSVAYGQKVRATNYWNSLVNGIQNIANHQNTAVASMIPTPTTAGKITFLNNISANLTSINANRLNAAASGATSVTSIVSTLGWSNSLTISIQYVFASQDNLRYFFNAGGQIGLSFSHPNTGSINSLFSDICSEAGTIWISSPSSGSVNIAGTNYNGVTKVGGVASGRSTVNSNYGFYAMNSTAVQIFNQTGDAFVPAYQGSFLRVSTYLNYNGQIILVCLFDEVPNGLVVSTGTTVNATLRPPSTTYLTNTWGTPVVYSSINWV